MNHSSAKRSMIAFVLLLSLMDVTLSFQVRHNQPSPTTLELSLNSVFPSPQRPRGSLIFRLQGDCDRSWIVHGHNRRRIFFPRKSTAKPSSSSSVALATSASTNSETIDDKDSKSSSSPPCTSSLASRKLFSFARFAGIANALVWTLVSIKVLSFHPDPKFVGCTLQHNVLTILQALCVPFGVLYASFGALRQLQKRETSDESSSYGSSSSTADSQRRRITLGILVTQVFLLAACSLAAPQFAFGMDLIPTPLKILAGIVLGSSSVGLCLLYMRDFDCNPIQLFKETVQALWSIAPRSNDSSINNNTALWSTATFGFLWFAIQPLVVPYPLATVPAILGKRLSRPASAFLFSAAVLSYTCKKEAEEKDHDGQGQSDDNDAETRKELSSLATIKTIKRGLGWGSATHLALVLLKLVGIDEGGLLIPGRGLWMWYPAMMACKFALAVSGLLHAMVTVAAFT